MKPATHGPDTHVIRSFASIDLNERWRRLLRVLLLAIPLGLTASICVIWLASEWGPGDALVYLAAGVRLNVGHSLYALVPGDAIVGFPVLGTIPLLSPPLIAVVWRPLALVEWVVVLTFWWVAMALLTAACIVVLYRRAFVATGLLLIPLAIPIAVLGMSGNIDCVRLAGSLAIWRLASTGRDRPSGAMAGLLVALKLTPAPLVWWLLLTGHRRAVVWAFATFAACLAVSLAGAGLTAHLDYLRVVFQTIDVGTSDWTIAGLARDVGVPPTVARFLPSAGAVVALLAMILLRHRPASAWVLGVIAMVLGAPVSAAHSFAGLLAALAPTAWPAASGSGLAAMPPIVGERHAPFLSPEA